MSDVASQRTAGLSHAAATVAEWLCLAATPAFAGMAVLTAVLGGMSDMSLLSDARWLTGEWNGADVLADERLPLGALVANDIR